MWKFFVIISALAKIYCSANIYTKYPFYSNIRDDFLLFLFKPEGKVSISLISRICFAKIFVICVSFCKWFSRKWVFANIRKWNFRFNPWSWWRSQPESWAANSFGWLGLIYVELLSHKLKVTRLPQLTD